MGSTTHREALLIQPERGAHTHTSSPSELETICLQTFAGRSWKPPQRGARLAAAPRRTSAMLPAVI